MTAAAAAAAASLIRGMQLRLIDYIIADPIYHNGQAKL